MRDRQPTQPGRVLLTPENGEAPFYAVMTMADEPEFLGDPPTTKNLLQDQTATLMGLLHTAVPNDAFMALGKYLAHWWKYRNVSGSYVSVTSAYTKTTLVWDDNSTATDTFLASSSINIDQATGEISLVNPSSVTVRCNSPGTASGLVGKYFKASSNTPEEVQAGVIYYADPDRSPGYDSPYSGEDRVYIYAGIVTTTYRTTPSNWEYVYSADRNAYPDSGTVDSVEYQYIGKPLDNSRIPFRCEAFSYTGTGTSGDSNPNSLTFAESPKIVMILAEGSVQLGGASIMGGDNDNGTGFMVYVPSMSTSYIAQGGFGAKAANLNPTYGKRSEDGKTIYWYSGSNARAQLNTSNTVYSGVAIYF